MGVAFSHSSIGPVRLEFTGQAAQGKTDLEGRWWGCKEHSRTDIRSQPKNIISQLFIVKSIDSEQVLI